MKSSLLLSLAVIFSLAGLSARSAELDGAARASDDARLKSLRERLQDTSSITPVETISANFSQLLADDTIARIKGFDSIRGEDGKIPQAYIDKVKAGVESMAAQTFKVGNKDAAGSGRALMELFSDFSGTTAINMKRPGAANDNQVQNSAKRLANMAKLLAAVPSRFEDPNDSNGVGQILTKAGLKPYTGGAVSRIGTNFFAGFVISAADAANAPNGKTPNSDKFDVAGQAAVDALSAGYEAGAAQGIEAVIQSEKPDDRAKEREKFYGALEDCGLI